MVESVKAASDVYSRPIAGEVAEVNDAVVDRRPASSTKTRRARGWLFKLKLANPRELDALDGRRGLRRIPQDHRLRPQCATCP